MFLTECPPSPRGITGAHQKQDEYDYQCDIDDSNESVALTASVRPSRQQHADEKQDQDNQQNGVKANDLLPVLTASASRARTQRASRMRQSDYTGARVFDKNIGAPEGRLFASAHGTVR